MVGLPVAVEAEEGAAAGKLVYTHRVLLFTGGIFSFPYLFMLRQEAICKFFYPSRIFAFCHTEFFWEDPVNA